MYQLPHVANAILYRAKAEDIPITQVKLQKMLYFLYKQYYLDHKVPLFSERFEPWTYGPVVTDVFYALRKYKGKPITGYCPDANGHLAMVRPELMTDLEPSFNRTWERYKRYTGKQLTDLTHKPGSAWNKAVEANLPYLRDEDIAAEPILT